MSRKELLPVHDYLRIVCDGNKAEFARKFNRKPQNVTNIFKRQDEYGVIITDRRDLLVQIATGNAEYIEFEGELYQVRSERVK